MEKTIARSNRASIGGHIVEKGVAIFGKHQVCMFCFIFIIICFIHGIGPKIFISALTQNMVLFMGAQLVKRDVIKIVINNDVVKLIGNLEGVIKTSGFTIIAGDGQFDSTGPGSQRTIMEAQESTKEDSWESCERHNWA